MTDTLTTIAVVGGASALWFGLQTLAWYAGLGRFCEYRTVRAMVIGLVFVSPGFVLLAQSVRFVLGFSDSVGEFILMPLGAAWIFLLSWGGLRVAAHLRGLSLPTSPTRNAEAEKPASPAAGSRR